MKLEPTRCTTTVTFQGDNVHKVLSDHFDVLKAVWALCAGMTDATIDCRVFPTREDAPILQWYVHISSPMGIRSIVATQRRPAAPIIFSNE